MLAHVSWLVLLSLIRVGIPGYDMRLVGAAVQMYVQ